MKSSILAFAEQGKSLAEVATNLNYSERNVERITSDAFGVTYTDLVLLYRLSNTFQYHNSGTTSLQKAYEKAGGDYSNYYRLPKKLRKYSLPELNQAAVVLKHLCAATQPIRRKSLKNIHSIPVLRDLGYTVISRPGRNNSGYFLSISQQNILDCTSWINNWRQSIGITPNFSI